MPRAARVRVYVPATLVDLRALVADDQIPTRGIGFAVTSSVRNDDPGGDDDDWEFAAFLDATAASLDLIRADGAEPRRVVVSADVDEADVDAVDLTGVPDAPDAGHQNAPAGGPGDPGDASDLGGDPRAPGDPAGDRARPVNVTTAPVAAGSRVRIPEELSGSRVAAVHIDGAREAGVVAAVVNGAPPWTLQNVALEWYHLAEVPALLGD